MSKLILFGGKGGTGKTTFASSAAIWVAQHGFRTLVISSDPAHSTSDSFEMKIGSEPTPIKGVDNLYGLEIDPAKELEDKLPSIKETLESPFKTLGFGELKVDASDLMLPGLDEALSFDALLHYLENPEFDVIIFDTAPTGHTLRFLSLPSLLDGWLMKILKMKKRINAVKNLFRSEKDDTIDEIIKLRRRIEHIIRIITDPKLTSFYIVLIPEKLAVEETKRAIKILQSYSIPIHGLLINNLFPEDEKCEFCKLRRQVQIQYIKEIEEYVKKNKLEVRLAFQEMLSEEVKGIETLRKIGENIFKKQLPLSLTKTFTMRKDGKATILSLHLPKASSKEIELWAEGKNLIIDINGIVNTLALQEVIEDKKISAKFKENVLEVRIE